jgi:hypothetical protein
VDFHKIGEIWKELEKTKKKGPISAPYLKPFINGDQSKMKEWNSVEEEDGPAEPAHSKKRNQLRRPDRKHPVLFELPPSQPIGWVGDGRTQGCYRL